MNRSLPNYRSYLVRFWYADNAGHPIWRAVVQEPGCETQQHFDDLAALCTWLAAQLALADTQGAPGEEQDKADDVAVCPD